MPVGLEVFRWQCAEVGYAWQDGTSLTELQNEISEEHRERRFLVIAPESRRAKVYQPLVDCPTLFKEFVSLEASEESFREFANEYGLLGVEHMLARNGPVQFGEPAHRWWEEWSRMGVVVDVLDAIQRLDKQALESWFHIHGDSASVHIKTRRGMYFGLVANSADLRPWLWKFSLGATAPIERLARLARGWVQGQVNESLLSRRNGESTVAARVLLNPEKETFGLHLVPTSLLAAMWLQCGRMLTVNPAFKSCEHCGRWFELSPDARRKQTRYCTDRCKVAAYRVRLSAQHSTQVDSKLTKSRGHKKGHSAEVKSDPALKTP